MSMRLHKHAIVIRQDALRSFVEAFWMVIVQRGPQRDDDKDQVIALCPRRCDAVKVQRALLRKSGR
jgi:hypothetical protein